WIGRDDRFTKDGLNDSLAEICSQQPEHFKGLINVPLTDVPAAIEELHRARRKPGMVGVTLGTNIAQKPLDSQEFWPFYEELDRLRLPVFIHPLDPVGMPLVRDYRMTHMVGYLFETCVAATRLVLSGTLEKYPNFPIILCHLGGALPFISNRIDRSTNANPEVRGRLSQSPSGYFRRMYYDTALSSGTVPMSCAYQYLGSGDHIVLGTDYPYSKPDHIGVVPAIEAMPWPAETKEKVFWKNASKLLGI
ncbi:MAG: amidohydrolase family protein, partial [Dehalococcoidia bacterium]|nr:amidohydrolase family protein [Dehalococcoidia bacterium]